MQPTGGKTLELAEMKEWFDPSVAPVMPPDHRVIAERYAASMREWEMAMSAANPAWWGWDSGAMRVKEPAPATVDVPVACAVAEPDGPDAEYLTLAERLGIRNGAILTAKLERVLHAEMIPVYEYAKVAAYLDHLAERRTHELRAASGEWIRSSWCWFSLRKGEHKGVHTANVSKSVYQSAIPAPVLLTIEKIQTQLPEARFFISAIVDVPDPFLAVSVPGADKLWVIERWDEPGFRS